MRPTAHKNQLSDSPLTRAIAAIEEGSRPPCAIRGRSPPSPTVPFSQAGSLQCAARYRPRLSVFLVFTMSLSLTAADGGFERSISLSIGEPVRFIHLCEGSVPGKVGFAAAGSSHVGKCGGSATAASHAPPALSALPRTVTLRNCTSTTSTMLMHPINSGREPLCAGRRAMIAGHSDKNIAGNLLWVLVRAMWGPFPDCALCSTWTRCPCPVASSRA